MTALRIILALAVVGVALAACGDASATPAATPSAAPTATLISVETPINAQEALNRACEVMVASDYDVTYTAVNPEGSMSIQARVSDGESHEVYTGMTTNGAIIARAEAIRIDGILYSRESIESAPHILGDWQIIGRDMPPAEPLPCFAPESFVSGMDQSSSLSERRYSSTLTQPEIPGETVLRELWINRDGRPVRGRTTYTYDTSGESQLGGASGAATNEAPTQIVINETYSGYGEPNVITAPVLPTPSPTPTAAP